MFRYFRQAFFEPLDERWFRVGLIIESASPDVANKAFAKLWDALPNIDFDLLARTERPGLPIRHTFRVKRPLDGLRLILRERRHYDLVVLFATGERELRFCRAVALLVMDPRRFFVFNEFGEGFWLHPQKWSQLQAHLAMRYDWENKRQRWKKRWDGIRAAPRRLYQGLLWAAWLGVRILLALYAGLLFLTALLMLAVLRVTYDTHYYRFRFFGKTAAAPRRKLTESEFAEDPLATPLGPSSHGRSGPLH